MLKCWNPIAILREQNRNVALNILVAIIGGISSGMYDTGGVMVAFLYKLSGDSNTDVGLVQAMSGGTMLLTALPIGYLADKLGRSNIIRAGAVPTLAFIALTASWSCGPLSACNA